MLLLRSSILAHLPSSSPASPVRRLLSATPPAISTSPSFDVQDYLVSTCGLTRSQAIMASAKLSHLKSPTNADAVLAFLSGLGLCSPDIAAVVARDPHLLCASVERTLAPVVVGLSGLGLSRSDIARLASLAAHKFREKSIVSSLRYYLRLFSSSENLFRVVKPNVAYLRECGLRDYHIAKLCIQRPKMFTANPKHLQALVRCTENIGVPRDCVMFKHALHAVSFHSEEEIRTRVEHLKNTFGWTDAEVGMAVSKFPTLLNRSKESLQRKSEFLISEVGLEPAYNAHRPVMLGYSLEGRVRPRYYAVKFLKENGLVDRDRGYYNTLNISEKVFMEKFICPHKEAAPHLGEDYAIACRGEVPARFSFT
ncbi:transcription termination factor MTERF8, chloroplastic-like [Triticum aestivum]|uniref:transcription termination factor MTERF8, chloroplastic-like n=1 Tax=Triticum aestivum TaxID=4565 RepID=UPI00194AB1BC|nr:transcription termination factor MTERF8, chloroplastic-like [Triticum aestivum]